MVIIGLTGNIGVGKSTVVAWLASRGVFALDADKLAHRVMEPGMPAHAQIVEAFGPAVLADDGAINRATLGAIVFRDPELLKLLESIVHPEVSILTGRLLHESGAEVAVVEAIKLLESKRLVAICTEIWVVTADEEAQLQRLMEGRAMDAAEARRRLAAQSSQQEKSRHATRVIHNNGTRADLYATLEAVWADFCRLHGVTVCQSSGPVQEQ